jgi:threonyl-tRNA synthetase
MTYERIVSPEKYDRTVRGMRSWLYSLIRRRNSAMITADDAHTYLDRSGFRKNEVYTRLSLINSVLRDTNFDVVGQVPSMRPAARRRLINGWTVR